MTILKLKNVNYKDFKGITHFEFEIEERNATVSGQNGTGKTSLLDGWLWLLLGKDSRGSKLNPKPLDVNNQEKLGLEPTVEAVAILNGKEVKLKKVQQEKWTQPRGQLEKERGNDTNKYFIDDVPVKEKEFKEFVGKICEEELVRILSDSTYFMTLKWEKRRQYLMKLARISEQEIVEQVGGQDLVELLDGKTAEERLKIVKAQIAEVKRNIEGLPAKIQENSDMQQQLRESLGNYESIIDKQNSLIVELKKAEKEHLTKISADPMADAKKELIRLEMKLSEARNSHTTRWQAEVNILQKEVFEKQAKLTRISDAMEEKQRTALNREAEVERLTNLIKAARS
ncbi:ATP-binding protein, partial [Enterococcus cecorum]|uniref:ATP-binding protein n=1 Tax=Enterococcus cecorum TaxID=44008 RepID=UPI00263F960F